MPTKVYIRPKPRLSAQGRHNYSTHNGQKMGKYKAKGATFYFSILEKAGTGRLNMGFEKLVPNPYLAKSKKTSQLPSNWINSDVWDQDYITMQTLMEIKHNKPKNFYDPVGVKERTLYRGDHEGKNRTYLQVFRRMLGDGENVVDTTKPEDEIFYIAALHSSLIANSKAEADASTHARFYISYTEEDEGAKAAKNERILTANAYLSKIQQDLPAEESYKFAVILGLTKKGGVAPKAVTNLLFEYINDKVSEQDVHIENFIRLYEERVDVTKKGIFNAKYLLKQLVNYRVLSDKGQKYTWITRTGSNLEVIARTEEQAIMWLVEEENKQFVEELEEELKIKM